MVMEIHQASATAAITIPAAVAPCPPATIAGQTVHMLSVSSFVSDLFFDRCASNEEA
jgi:hypothetical protein